MHDISVPDIQNHPIDNMNIRQIGTDYPLIFFTTLVGLVAFKTKQEVVDQYLARAKAIVGLR